ncbi:MAG TPA: chromosome partitioning protein ParB [Alphaproteobacteria bacterium]|nr:chromosome partitioning protein ParB [Alphaproteobacteria bacterium]HAJ47736.1 chromosome partitioning protein ParB [Alphaproteobacteria bacterium]
MTKPGQRNAGLGRGLSALLGDRDPDIAAPTAEPARGLKTVPITQLKPNPFQPRRVFNPQELDDLANSVREKGILQPLVVRPAPGQTDAYQIIAGERRWRAAQKAQLHEVPVIIRELTDVEALEIAIIENVQRADLNAIEEARGYKQLADEFSYTQEQIAKIIGKSRSHIANTVRLLNLPDGVQQYILEGKLSAGHARSLVNAPDPERQARELVEAGMSVRETEKKVQATKPKSAKAPAVQKDVDTRAMEQSVSNQLGLAVAVKHQGDRGGQVVISYKTLDQLDDICARLSQSSVL